MVRQLRIDRLWILLIVVGVLLAASGQASAITVTFPDANLESEVRIELGIPTPTPITDVDMESMRFFTANSHDIANIQGLQYATNIVLLHLDDNQISDISVLSGLTTLNGLRLTDNQISDFSTIAGLTNLFKLDLGNNQISDISPVVGLTNLDYFSVEDNPLTDVILKDATLNQDFFNALMNGGASNFTGLAEVSGILTLDFSGADFTSTSDLSTMYSMDDLQKLLLSEAISIDGDQVVSLTDELDSLNWLDVTGLWDSFDGATQSSLNSWDAIGGNTLVTTPEPGTLSLLWVGIMGLMKRRRNP